METKDTLEISDILYCEREISLSNFLTNDINLSIIRNNKVVYSGNESGIKALVGLYENDRNIFLDSLVCDRIIGKAAAIILILGRVNEVFGEVLSESAFDLLNRYNIKLSFKEKPKMIINRKKNGMCPLENAVFDEDNLEIGYLKILQTLKKLNNNIQ